MHFTWNSELKVCRCMCGTFHICMYILAIVSASGVVHFLLPIMRCQKLCFPPKQASLLAGPKLWSVTGQKRNTMASCFNQVGDWIHYNFPSGVWNIKKDTILKPNSSCAFVMIDRLTLRNGQSSAMTWKLFSLSMLDYNWSNHQEPTQEISKQTSISCPVTLQRETDPVQSFEFWHIWSKTIPFCMMSSVLVVFWETHGRQALTCYWIIRQH